MDLKTLKDLRIEEELCSYLDAEVYLPVKEELKGCGRTYSLGMRKEDFKGFLDKKFKELRQLIIEWIKYARRCKHQLNVPETFKTIFSISEEELK